MAASANGTLPASARQVMYQARPFIQEKMGGQQLNDQYFCQQLLPDYMEENGVDWDITYDDRGHFTEPHTEHSIGLGTISVRDYLASIGAPKLEEPSFAAGKRRYTRAETAASARCCSSRRKASCRCSRRCISPSAIDLAIMSTKGMSSTAARTLIDNLCQHQDAAACAARFRQSRIFDHRHIEARHAAIHVRQQDQDHRSRSAAGRRPRARPRGTAPKLPSIEAAIPRSGKICV